jgi:hypothetical protein
MKHTSALFVILVFHATICVSRGDIYQQLQEWVDASTLTFTGTIVKMGVSNVSGIDTKDFPMIVQVEKVYSGRVAADQPLARPVRSRSNAAVFF